MNDLENQSQPKHWLRNYLPMWIGQAFSILGSNLVQFALIWYLTEQTGSATVLATATLIGLIPGVFLGPFAGALVDRWNRKLTMILSDSLVALATLVLALLFATDLIQAWHIYTVMFVRSMAGIFQFPAMKASVSLMVPGEIYAKLSGVNQVLDGVITIGGPPLGALLLAALPMQGVLGVDLVTAVLAIGLLVLFVKVPQPARADAVDKVSVRQVLLDVRDGFRYAITWPGIIMLLIGATLINMAASPAFSLMPLLIQEQFGGAAAELGWMESAFGIGLLGGGLLLGVWGGFKRKTLTIFIAILGMGIGITALGLVPGGALIAAYVVMGFVGLMSPFANGPLGALLQTKVQPEMQGRIFSVMNSLMTATVPLGLMFAGPVAKHLGIRVLYLATGLICLLVGIGGLLIKAVYTLDDQAPGGKILATSIELDPKPAQTDS